MVRAIRIAPPAATPTERPATSAVVNLLAAAIADTL